MRAAARDLSRAIEEYAKTQGSVSALVVPWESSATTISMAVTSVRADGWAIEHTNLGTITLTDEGGATRVNVTATDPDHADKSQLATVFARFARQLEAKFGRRDDETTRRRDDETTRRRDDETTADRRRPTDYDG